MLFINPYSPTSYFSNTGYDSPNAGQTALKKMRATWWRHQMETFSALLVICAGNSPATGEFPAQRPMTRSFDVFFDLDLYKWLNKQWWGWWFKKPSCPLWRHCNDRPLPNHNKTQQSMDRLHNYWIVHHISYSNLVIGFRINLGPLLVIVFKFCSKKLLSTTYSRQI